MLGCYFRLMRAGFRRYSTYRQAVVPGLATNVVFGFIRCAVLLTVFAGSAQVAGYDPSATVTFVWIGQGLIAAVLIWGNADFGERVRSGDVAVDLLRPVDLQAVLLAEDVDRAGFALLTRFTFLLLITPLTGLVLLGAIWVAASATTFWLVEGQELPNAVTYGSGMFTSYPVSIFSGWLLQLMAFVVPGAFVAYYPALAIFGKPDPLGLPPVLQYSAQLVAVLAAGVAALIWRAGLRHYVGTGS